MKPRLDDIPQDVWDAAEAAGEAMHGRHERGWVAWPLIPASGTTSHQEIVARALMAERMKERERVANVDEPVWLAELDVLRAGLRVAELILDTDRDHTIDEQDRALSVVREAIARKPPTSIRSRP